MARQVSSEVKGYLWQGEEEGDAKSFEEKNHSKRRTRGEEECRFGISAGDGKGR